MTESTADFGDEVDEATEDAPGPPALSTDLASVVQDYMPLVRHCVNRVVAGAINSSILQYEDMVSCGVQGLIEALQVLRPQPRRQVLDLRPAAHPRLDPGRVAGGAPAAAIAAEGLLGHR